MLFVILASSVADPGFPIGGRAPIRGSIDLRHRHFLVKMYAKTKELGPIGEGVHLAQPPHLDLPMIIIKEVQLKSKNSSRRLLQY